MNCRSLLTALLIFVLINTFSLYAKTSVQASFINNHIKLDGRLDEPVWQQATVINEFYQREPFTGEPVSESTIVYIYHNNEYIYFGFKCFDDPGTITAKEMARDVSLGEDDRVQVILDTFLDQRNAYWFQIGPRGSIGDALVSQNGAAFNKQWDGLWDGKARIHEKGWDAEIAIPFKTLNFRKGQTTWGLKIIRHVKRKLESAYWPIANLNTYRFQVSDAGFLTGMENMSQGIGLDISPYGLVGLDQKINEDTEFPKDAGFDLFYQITPGLKSALTVNTDFAQTEVDSRQINLTRFQLHFPEKRDFFLDGANYFNFGIDSYTNKIIPFFSRRMGLDDGGNPVPIVWGGKITGQVGQWNMGLLNMIDERQGKNQNFTVARLKRNFASQSSIGMIGTWGNALSADDNQLLGVDIKLASSTFHGDKNIAMHLFGLKSWTDGLSKNDKSFGAQIVYPNDFFSYRLGYHQIENNFRAGMGFVPRLGIRESYIESALSPRPKRWGILQTSFKVDLDYLTDMNNRLLTREWTFTPLNIRFNSGDEITFLTNSQYDYLAEDFNIYSDIAITQDAYDFWRYTIGFESAQRRHLWFSTNYIWGSFYDGHRENYNIAFGYKINVPLYLGMEFEHNDVSLKSGHFDTDILRLNANILFSPNLTLYNFVQYDNYSKSIGWQSRFQWILKPGNEILFVWTSLWADPFDRFKVTESAPRLKVKYNYRF